MDIRVLRYFLTVAREESFSRAADALYLSQPTLSRQIREMEEELGVQLLIRTNRNVRLTQEGHRLRRRAQEIVDLIRHLLFSFVFCPSPGSGHHDIPILHKSVQNCHCL